MAHPGTFRPGPERRPTRGDISYARYCSRRSLCVHRSLPGEWSQASMGGASRAARAAGGDLLVAENFTSRARAAAAEERGVALENAGGRDAPFRAASHGLERGRLHQHGPGRRTVLRSSRDSRSIDRRPSPRAHSRKTSRISCTPTCRNTVAAFQIRRLVLAAVTGQRHNHCPVIPVVPVTGEQVVPCCWRHSAQGGPMPLASDSDGDHDSRSPSLRLFTVLVSSCRGYR